MWWEFRRWVYSSVYGERSCRRCEQVLVRGAEEQYLVHRSKLWRRCKHIRHTVRTSPCSQEHLRNWMLQFPLGGWELLLLILRNIPACDRRVLLLRVSGFKHSGPSVNFPYRYEVSVSGSTSAAVSPDLSTRAFFLLLHSHWRCGRALPLTCFT